MHGECDFCQKISNGSQILVSIASTEETINSGTDFLSLSLIENFFFNKKLLKCNENL